MASDTKMKCKVKECNSTPFTCSPLGRFPHCRHHFNSYMKAEKNGEGVCSWYRGCESKTLKVGLLHLRVCHGHLSYSLLLTGITTSKKRESDSLKNVLTKEMEKSPPADGRCHYVYREQAEGYHLGQRCTQSINGDYCDLHHELISHARRVVEGVRKDLSVYSSALVKLPSKRVHLETSREEYCRSVMERLTGHKFPSCWPEWMKRPTTKRGLQLDGYCEELKVAFEHDGHQHYTWPNSFHKTKDEYNKQVERDTLKEGYCKIQGVHLIRVRADMPLDDIEAYLVKRLDEYHISTMKELEE